MSTSDSTAFGSSILGLYGFRAFEAPALGDEDVLSQNVRGLAGEKYEVGNRAPRFHRVLRVWLYRVPGFRPMVALLMVPSDPPYQASSITPIDGFCFVLLVSLRRALRPLALRVKRALRGNTPQTAIGPRDYPLAALATALAHGSPREGASRAPVGAQGLGLGTGEREGCCTRLWGFVGNPLKLQKFRNPRTLELLM